MTNAVTSANILTATLRYSHALITVDVRNSAALLTDALSGSATLYFALKSQNEEGLWSALSNLAFWPRRDLWSPIVIRQ